MKKIEFSREERAEIVKRIQIYFHEELESEIGNIPTELLLEFFTSIVGAYYYNRGLNDAQVILRDRMDEFTDAVFALEQPTDYSK